MHTLGARDMLFGYESYDSRQILDNQIKKFWISQDFKNSGETIFKP